MTYHSISRILEILADETAELAAIAQTLDQVIPTLIRQLPVGVDRAPRDLQRVDALYQHLQDTSRALRKMAVLVEPGSELNSAVLIDEVRLEYFKNLLRDAPAPPNPGPDQGEAQLF